MEVRMQDRRAGSKGLDQITLQHPRGLLLLYHLKSSSLKCTFELDGWGSKLNLHFTSTLHKGRRMHKRGGAENVDML